MFNEPQKSSLAAMADIQMGSCCNQHEPLRCHLYNLSSKSKLT
jgi:hypothetical protein